MDSPAPIGTAHPSVFVAAAPDGRWVVVCQARADTDGDGRIAVHATSAGGLVGDALVPYLVVGAGPGVALDDFAGADPAGRHVAVVRQGRLFVLDTVAGTDAELSDADVTTAPEPFGRHRAADFDASGARMVYLRARGRRTAIVVRDLPTGREAVVDPGPGRVWRAGLDPTGRWVVVQLHPPGPGDDLPQELAVLSRAAPRRASCLPSGSLAHVNDAPDPPVTRFAPAAGGVARAWPAMLLPLGAGVLVRAADGALVLARDRPPAVEVVPAACGARLLYADVARGQVLVACAARGTDHAPAELHGAAVHRPLGVDVRVAADDLSWGLERFRAVRTVDGAVVVDLERHVVRRLPDDAEASVVGRFVVQSRPAGYVVTDATTGVTQTLAGPACARPRERAGAAALLGALVVDLAPLRVVGAATRGWSVTRAFQVLEDSDDDAAVVVRGPFRWRRPWPRHAARCLPAVRFRRVPPCGSAPCL